MAHLRDHGNVLSVGTRQPSTSTRALLPLNVRVGMKHGLAPLSRQEPDNVGQFKGIIVI